VLRLELGRAGQRGHGLFVAIQQPQRFAECEPGRLRLRVELGHPEERPNSLLVPLEPGERISERVPGGGGVGGELGGASRRLKRLVGSTGGERRVTPALSVFGLQLRRPLEQLRRPLERGNRLNMPIEINQDGSHAAPTPRVFRIKLRAS
jgi:hypothetical protein